MLKKNKEKEIRKERRLFIGSLASESEFSFIPASIVKLSRNKQHNYFILNKGSEDSGEQCWTER